MSLVRAPNPSSGNAAAWAFDASMSRYQTSATPWNGASSSAPTIVIDHVAERAVGGVDGVGDVGSVGLQPVVEELVGVDAGRPTDERGHLEATGVGLTVDDDVLGDAHHGASSDHVVERIGLELGWGRGEHRGLVIPEVHGGDAVVAPGGVDLGDRVPLRPDEPADEPGVVSSPVVEQLGGGHRVVRAVGDDEFHSHGATR